MLNTIVSLFTIFLYAALGTYVLTKNSHERTNQIFALLMLAFIVWSMGTYDTGLVAEDAPPREVLLSLKIQLSGVIIALTLFVFFARILTKTERAFKNPFAYPAILPSLYIIYLIWTAEVSGLGMLSPMAERKQEFFFFSAVFGIAGVYLLLRYYMASKYRHTEQAKIILAGAIAAVLIAITANIIMPLFFDLYYHSVSTLAPAVMGVFFAYAVYQYGLFIRPMPELSVTSFCGIECTLCHEYLDNTCPGCRFNKERYKNCKVYRCISERGHKDCGDCHEIITCLKRKDRSCIGYMPGMKTLKYCLNPGGTYFVKDGYALLRDQVKCGALGIVATTTHPQQIREKYHLATTPIVWISDEAVEMGVKPADIKRLSILLINFMKKIGNAAVLLDDIDKLIAINGFDNMQWVIQMLNSTAQATSSCLIVSTDQEGEALDRLRQGVEIIKAG